MLLLDELMPRYDLHERHSVLVRAEPDTLYAALRRADLGASRLVRFLLALRALPATFGARGTFRQRLARPRGCGTRGLTIAAAADHGFAVLAEAPPREIVLGIEGRFWTPSGGLRPTSALAFRQPPASGTARGAWNFHLEPVGDGRTRLSTETRVLAADAGSRRRMMAYWLVIRPGSGLIRRIMLTAIRRRAEQSGSA